MPQNHTFSTTIYILISLISSKQNAVIFTLCRNSDLSSLQDTLKSFESTFNKKYSYPYVFFNDEEFTDEFKTGVRSVVTAPVQFGKLSEDEFGVPDFIDKNKMESKINDYSTRGVIYGGSLSYRKMCRFYSGKFYNLPLVKKYEFFWRIEPGVKFFCKMNYDPFEFMKENGKLYGFVISIHEYMETIPTLWEATQEFMAENRDVVCKEGLKSFFKDGEYGGCHFWSNFEIASFAFFRSEGYEKYFAFLDKKGGFFYERWGDAPVHTIAASILIDKNKLHFFDDIGYEHPPIKHCPRSPSRLVDCECDPEESIELKPFSCMPKYSLEVVYGVVM